MQAITTNSLDIAKSIFQANGLDAEGKVAVRLGGGRVRANQRRSCLTTGLA